MRSEVVEIEGTGHLAKELGKIPDNSRVLLGFENGAVATITIEGNLGTLANTFVNVSWLEVLCSPPTAVQWLLMGREVAVGLLQTSSDSDVISAFRVTSATEVSSDYLTPRGLAILTAIQQGRVDYAPLVLPSIHGAEFRVLECIVGSNQTAKTRILVGEVVYEDINYTRKVWFEIPEHITLTRLTQTRKDEWSLVEEIDNPVVRGWAGEQIYPLNECNIIAGDLGQNHIQ